MKSEFSTWKYFFSIGRVGFFFYYFYGGVFVVVLGWVFCCCCCFLWLVICLQDHSLICILLLSSQNCFVESHQISCGSQVYFSPLVLYPQILVLYLWKRLIWVDQLWFCQAHIVLSKVLKLSIRFINQPILLLKLNFSVSNFPSLSISSMGKSRFNRLTLNLKHHIMQFCHAIRPAFTDLMC